MKQGRISSGWTIPTVIMVVALWIILPWSLVFSGVKALSPTHAVFGFIASLVLSGIAIYLTFSLTTAEVYGREIIFRRLFEREKSYSFGCIGQPVSFEIRGLKFTSVKMEDTSGRIEKYLILNVHQGLFRDTVDAKRILTRLRNNPQQTLSTHENKE